MANEKIIVVPAHIEEKRQLLGLQRCISSLRKHTKYPILLTFSGDINLVADELKTVDEYIYTTTNSLLELNSPLYVFYETAQWKLTYDTPCPRKYHGLAHMQKISLGLEGAIGLGYNQFLIINYDAILMDDGFADYMFSENVSIFFRYRNTTFTNTDVFKVNKDGATLIKNLADYTIYTALSNKIDGEMVENILTHLLNTSSLKVRILESAVGSAFQLPPFKIMVNTVSSGEATAVVIDNKIHLLITSQGSPMHTLDGKLEIGYGGKFTTFDVSSPFSMLFPITDYTNNDVDIVVRTSFGEFPIVVKNSTLKNTTLKWYNN